MSDPDFKSRKNDHIDLAFASQVKQASLDSRFYYEPMLTGHPEKEEPIGCSFLNFKLQLPIWVSSMTGGTEKAAMINENLARACGTFGMGMGLGSCRSLLFSDDRISDFAVKKWMPDHPLFANLGIAQVQELVAQNKFDVIKDLLAKLDADGLIIHVNPMQEWLQPEGDRYADAPVETISRVLDAMHEVPIIVKEVGQGMGRESLRALYALPLAAVDFAAAGGTNFALLELMRSTQEAYDSYHILSQIGHTAEEMVEMANDIFETYTEEVLCDHTIISGGVNNFLDGYYLTEKLSGKAIYGQASKFLEPAMKSYEALASYVEQQKKGLQLAQRFLNVK